MSVEVRIPTLGESVNEGVIVRWAKRDGEAVNTDVLLELETDKASMEIPAPRGGILRILKPEGEKVTVGDVVARIDEDGKGRAAAAAPAPTKEAAPATEPVNPPPVPSAQPNLEAAS